jgi:hypothetical protein
MHRLGPESQGLEAVSAQDLVANRVVGGLLQLAMMGAIDLDHQTTAQAGEVGIIAQQRGLSPKVEALGL